MAISFIELPPIDFLSQFFELDASIPEGIRWRDRPREHFRHDLGFKFFQSKWPGKPAGCISGKYYRVALTYKRGGEWVSVNLHNHRIIWTLQNGEDPGQNIVDHSNRDKRDNEGGNLRLADHIQSSQNRRKRSDNLSGVAGVSFRPDINKWRARITVSKRILDLGSFDTLEEAAAVRKAAEIEHFGSFAPSEVA